MSWDKGGYNTITGQRGYRSQRLATRRNAGLDTFAAMRIYLCFCMIAGCLLGMPSAFSQLTWQHSYGGYSTDEGSSVVVTSDGNYLIVGSTGSFGAGGGDIYLLLLDPSGERIWSRTLGNAGVDQGRQVRQTSDGGFVLTGFTNGSGAGGYDGYVAKVTGQGDLLWERTYGGTGWDFLYSISICTDGGFIAAGETFSDGTGGGDAWVLKLDGSGAVQWNRTYGYGQRDFARCVIALSGGNYMIAGAVTVNGDQDAWLVKLSNSGAMVWNSTQGGDSADYAASVIQASDGGYAAVGTTKSYNVHTEALHFKVDQDGGLLWLKDWGQVNDQETLEQEELSDGRFVSVGYVSGGGSGGKDMFILFTDAGGDFIAGVTNGGDHGEGDEFGASLDIVPGDGFVFCGYTESFGFGTRDVYVVKTDSVGLTQSISVVSELDPVSTEEFVQVEHMYLSPNPASITCHLSNAEHLYSADLFDMQGRLVRSWSGRVPKEFDLRGLPDGMYRFSSIDDAARRTSLPLVIQFR